mmetsp:Transcript_17930/g.55694  ORF Transcript_17930/g.55694 Transcript_17930/m.55694 type:complete len:263 (-) Transcript_17930:959-1747(-)
MHKKLRAPHWVDDIFACARKAVWHMDGKKRDRFTSRAATAAFHATTTPPSSSSSSSSPATTTPPSSSSSSPSSSPPTTISPPPPPSASCASWSCSAAISWSRSSTACSYAAMSSRCWSRSFLSSATSVSRRAIFSCSAELSPPPPPPSTLGAPPEVACATRSSTLSRSISLSRSATCAFAASASFSASSAACRAICTFCVNILRSCSTSASFSWICFCARASTLRVSRCAASSVACRSPMAVLFRPSKRRWYSASSALTRPL